MPFGCFTRTKFLKQFVLFLRLSSVSIFLCNICHSSRVHRHRHHHHHHYLRQSWRWFLKLFLLNVSSCLCPSGEWLKNLLTNCWIFWQMGFVIAIFSDNYSLLDFLSVVNDLNQMICKSRFKSLRVTWYWLKSVCPSVIFDFDLNQYCYV